MRGITPRDQALNDHLFEHWLTPARAARIRHVLAHRTRYLTVVLEDIFQPHNASAVLRNCDLFGVQDVHIIESRNTFAPNKEVALGTDRWLTLHRYADRGDNDARSDGLAALKSAGYLIAATCPYGDAIPITEVPLDAPIALCFGSEKPGLSDHLLDAADLRVTLPMVGMAESFNISVSAALCLYELTDTLRASDHPWPLTDAEKLVLSLGWAKRGMRNIAEIERRFDERRAEHLAARNS
jgi:tRNA (guanosine-2'-O-)-methyltransferase